MPASCDSGWLRPRCRGHQPQSTASGRVRAKSLSDVERLSLAQAEAPRADRQYRFKPTHYHENAHDVLFSAGLRGARRQHRLSAFAQDSDLTVSVGFIYTEVLIRVPATTDGCRARLA